jgi:hypothetical protein
MATSRVNLSTLVVALIAGLVILHETQNILTSVAGLTLLVAIFAFGQDNTRTSTQSFAFALICGLALLCTCSYALKSLFGPLVFFSGQDVLPPLFWLAASTMFWFVDRSHSESGQPQPQLQPVSFSGYTQPQPVAPPPQPAGPRPTYETRPFTPAPVIVSAPPPPPPPAVEPEVEPEPVYAAPAPVAAPSAPTAPVPAAAPVPLAAPILPALTGKEVNIYVTMLGEGMNVLRTVRAQHLGRDFYVIVDEMPSDENWEFVPGQVVRCKKKNLSNGKGLVAFEEAPRAQQP